MPMMTQVMLAPPPPITVVSVRSAPAAPSMPGIIRQDDSAGRFVIDVDVRADDTVLWQGPLRVASGSSTSVRREQSEPLESDCDQRRGYGSIQQTSLSLQLQVEQYGDADPRRVRVTVRWSRPGAAACPTVAGARTVELNDLVNLPPGGSTTLTGDGGLVVRLHRR